MLHPVFLGRDSDVCSTVTHLLVNVAQSWSRRPVWPTRLAQSQEVGSDLLHFSGILLAVPPDDVVKKTLAERSNIK